MKAQHVRTDTGLVISAIAVLAASLTMLGALMLDARVAEAAPLDGMRLKIVRTVEWTYPDQEHWQWKTEGTASLENGAISGTVSTAGTVHSPGGSCDEYTLSMSAGSQVIDGTYQTNPDEPAAIDFSFKTPVKLVRTCVKGRPPPAKDDGGWWQGLSDTLEFSDAEPVAAYHGTLTGGTYSHRNVVHSNVDIVVTTQITLVGGGTGKLVVSAEHGLIPGHSALINAIDIEIPKSVRPSGTGPMTLRVSIGQAGYGGLSQTAEAARAGRGSRSLEIAGIEPGSRHRVYYGWHGDLVPNFTEKVTAQVLGEEIEGTASFRVGFGVAMTGFGRFTATEPKNREVVPFKLTAKATGQGDAGSLPQLAEKFDLQMVLGIERIGFQPINSVEGLLSALSFNLGDWAEALAGQGVSLDAQETGKSPGSLYGDKLFWRVGPDGRLWDPAETDPALKFPNYLPFQRGVHFLRAQVTGIAHDDEVLNNPDPKPAGHVLHVELKNDAQAFMDDVVLGCIEEILGSVTDEVMDAIKKDPSQLAKLELGAGGLLWGCIHNGLQTQIAQDWLAEHINYNTLVLTFLQTAEDISTLKDKIKNLLGAAASNSRLRAIVFVDGLSQQVSAVSSEDGRLKAAPSPFDAKPDGATAKSVRADRSQTADRLLRRQGRQAFYVRKGENIRLSLPADAQADVVLITPTEVRKLQPHSAPGKTDRVYVIPAN